jgi:hypothetical protein
MTTINFRVKRQQDIAEQRKNAVILNKALKELRSLHIQAHRLKKSDNSGNQYFYELAANACKVQSLDNINDYLVCHKISESKSELSKFAMFAWKGNYDLYVKTFEKFGLKVLNKGELTQKINVELIAA